MPHSVWRRVRARVHLSLTPVELSNPVRSATRKAFSSLLMRYNPELGGAVVAHIGPVELCGPPAFIDASPFAHVAAIANLLVFAPTKGTELLGVVTHVGPDHLGLSVLAAFHAVLPIDGLDDIYHFEIKYTNFGRTPMWRRTGSPEHVTVGRQIRFVVSDLKPTRTGLFQIIASLDPALRHSANDSHPLGLLPRECEISLSAQSLQQHSDTVERQQTDVLHVTKRTTPVRANDRLEGDELLTAGNDMLGDALVPTATPITPITPVSALKQKKRRRIGTEPRSVSFEGSGREAPQSHLQSRIPLPSSEQRVSNAVPSPTAADKEGNGASQNGIKPSEKNEMSDRKKRKKERKEKKEERKKKKKARSGDTDQPAESVVSVPSQESCPPSATGKKAKRKDGNEGDRDGDLLSATKLEERTADDGVETREREVSEGGIERSSSSRKKEGKKSKKKKKREKDRSSAKQGSSPSRTEENVGEREEREVTAGEASKEREKRKSRRESDVVVKMETKKKGDGEKHVNRTISMRRDAEKAVELGPMEEKVVAEAEDTVDDARGLVQTQAQVGERGKEGHEIDTEETPRKKKKKKRRRSQGGDEHHDSKRKKKKKRKRTE